MKRALQIIGCVVLAVLVIGIGVIVCGVWRILGEFFAGFGCVT